MREAHWSCSYDAFGVSAAISNCRVSHDLDFHNKFTSGFLTEKIFLAEDYYYIIHQCSNICYSCVAYVMVYYTVAVATVLDTAILKTLYSV